MSESHEAVEMMEKGPRKLVAGWTSLPCPGQRPRRRSGFTPPSPPPVENSVASTRSRGRGRSGKRSVCRGSQVVGRWDSRGARQVGSRGDDWLAMEAEFCRMVEERSLRRPETRATPGKKLRGRVGGSFPHACSLSLALSLSGPTRLVPQAETCPEDRSLQRIHPLRIVSTALCPPPRVRSGAHHSWSSPLL